MSDNGSTGERILDAAERLLQSRGYNGFAYRDIAGAVGIRNASIHYHFPTKADLGAALVRRYGRRFEDELERIEAESDDPSARLGAYADLFRQAFEPGNRLCLCGMMAAELASLPETVRAEVGRFFAANLAWLAEVFRDGRAASRVTFEGTPEARASMFLATLEGAMLVARGLDDPTLFTSATERFLGDVTRPERAHTV